jgi:hypothetical protein
MSKTEDAVAIIVALGLPRAQQNERSALTLLALTDLKENTPWQQAKQRLIRIHDIMIFIEKHYKKKYAENTRETIRRQTLHQFEQAGVAERNPDNPSRATNSPNNVYQVSDDALSVVRKFDSPNWERAVKNFTDKKGKLIERYEKRKKKYSISVNLPNGSLVSFSPGKHNVLQVKIIQDFRARFCPNAEVVYVGDTARKMLHIDTPLLKKLKIPITRHDKLPDVVLYDARKSILILVEAVTAHGPLSPKRQIELEETLKDCKAKRIYVSAFPDFREFKKHIDNIAWETEVWIQDNPDHMIHFNGPKFFNVYNE